MKVEAFPNREVRVTLVRSQVAKPFSYETHNETDQEVDHPSSPTCHSLKTLQPATERHSKDSQGQGLKAGYGGLPRFQVFSTYGRRQLLRAGGALDRYAPSSDCLFLTLTLPGSTRQAIEALARYSSHAVKMLKSWLSNYIPSNMSMYTWEWQRRGALHLHYVVHCPDKERGEWIKANLQRQWIRILDSICEASKIDLYRKTSGFSWASNKEITRTDAQWCEKSVAAYLSKYVSKAAKNNKTMNRNTLCPARWYGVSRPLLKLTRELTWSVSLDSIRDREALSDYENILSVLQSFSIKCYEYKHVVGDGKTIVAYVHDNEKETIWNSIMTNIPTPPDSSASIGETLRAVAQQGIYAMKKSKPWLSTFKQFCQNSRPAHLISSPLCKDITANDLMYVLDMLLYTYRYTERTRCDLNGSSKLWYSKVMSTLEAAESSGVSWVSPLLPRKE